MEISKQQSEEQLLLSPVSFAGMDLKNRVVMAPMTRSRAEFDGTPTAIMKEYYRQRATAGLIISEAINISKQGFGHIYTPGLFNQKQIEAWKQITEAVHVEGGKIVAQLLHGGRIGHIVLSGVRTVAPSALRPEGKTHLPTGMADYETPQELTIAQIKEIVDDFVVAAQNALLAGFDAVEIHGANGYLPNQFLSENTNQRTDAYGGSVQNRARFVLDVVQALTRALGPNKVGIRLSPSGTNNGAAVLDPLETYSYLINELNKEDLAYLHLMEGFRVESLPAHFPKEVAATFRPLFKGAFIASGGMTTEKAEEWIQTGLADLVAFGAAFIANPDLVARMKTHAALATPDRATYYAGGAKGYIDYPTFAG